mmetsp:Transcript_44572/g.144767  ORF Transcript_44572/g.144767 Transcript_44572/m.144767 type:complete len:284 (-) Transcript_44572:1661-2512(-)
MRVLATVRKIVVSLKDRRPHGPNSIGSTKGTLGNVVEAAVTVLCQSLGVSPTPLVTTGCAIGTDDLFLDPLDRSSGSEDLVHLGDPHRTALVAPGIPYLGAFVIVKEPVLSSGNVAIELVVKGLKVGGPDVFVPRKSLLEASHGVSPHDGHCFFSGKPKVFLHESHRHGPVEMLVGKGFDLFRHVGFFQSRFAILTTRLEDKGTSGIDFALVFSLKLCAHDRTTVRRSSVAITGPVVSLDALFDRHQGCKGPEIGSGLARAAEGPALVGTVDLPGNQSPVGYE